MGNLAEDRRRTTRLPRRPPGRGFAGPLGPRFKARRPGPRNRLSQEAGPRAAGTPRGPASNAHHARFSSSPSGSRGWLTTWGGKHHRRVHRVRRPLFGCGGARRAGRRRGASSSPPPPPRRRRRPPPPRRPVPGPRLSRGAAAPGRVLRGAGAGASSLGRRVAVRRRRRRRFAFGVAAPF